MDSSWQVRISAADKLFKEWKSKFKCTSINEYMEGFQWKDKYQSEGSVSYRPYTLNLFLTTRNIKLANWIFQRPSFAITPSEQNSNMDFESAVLSAEMKQDVLNAVVHNPDMNFAAILKLVAQDSFSYFGMVEVGYAKDWRNPQKLPDLTAGWEDPEAEKPLKIVKQNKLGKDEYAYIKRIKPNRFRAAVADAEFINDLPWFGYYEYYSAAELQNAPNIKWPKSAVDVGVYDNAETTSGVVGTGTGTAAEERLLKDMKGVVKTWHIWDKIKHQRLLFLDGHFDEPLFEEDFETDPLVDLRWIQREEGYYPVPLAYNWLSEQDEVNEAREQLRSYRRRYTRKFQYVKNQIEPDELEKFESGPDGVMIEVAEANAITPIQNPDFTQTTSNELLIAKDDFNLVSGTSVDARDQAADRETATQANLLNQRAQIRESSEQLDFSNFVCMVGRKLLHVIAENMNKSMWIKYTNNPTEQQPLSEVQVNQPLYREIKAEHLDDGVDFTVDLDVINATPAAMAQQKTAFVEFLTLVQQYPAIAMSGILIREAAFRCGYRNEQVIHQYQQVAVLSMAAKAAQAAQLQGKTLSQVMPPSNASNATLQQMQPPTQPQIASQIDQTQQNPVNQ